MQRLLAALCASAALLGATGTAAAHETVLPTTVAITETGDPDPREVTVSGTLTAPAACRAGREIEVLARYGEWTHRHVWAPGPWGLLGMVDAEADGTLAATLDRPTLWSMKFRVPRARVGSRGHRHICAGDAAGMSFQLA